MSSTAVTDATKSVPQETVKPLPKDRFKTNLSLFVQYMGTVMSEYRPGNVDPLVVSIVLAVIQGTNPDTMMDKFIDRSKDYWDIILEKREDTLLSSILILFKDLPQDQVKSISDLFLAKNDKGDLLITQDKRDIIWSYIWAFVKIGIKHVHVTRKPEINDKGVKAYSVKYFPEINVRINAEKWKIKVDE
jgi:hypothetical protein